MILADKNLGEDGYYHACKFVEYIKCLQSREQRVLMMRYKFKRKWKDIADISVCIGDITNTNNPSSHLSSVRRLHDIAIRKLSHPRRRESQGISCSVDIKEYLKNLGQGSV